MSDLGNSEIQGKRILVAGAGGFLGQHLVERLLQAGAEVLAVSRRPQGESRARLQRIRADMVDRAAIRSIFNELSPDIVYQLCGRPDGGRDLSLVIPTLESDILTTVNLLLAAAEKPVRRFITTASLEESVGGEAPISPYAAAKMSSVTYAKMFHRVYNVPVVVLRPFMTYGPKQPGTKIVSYLIRSLLSGEVPKLSSGTRMVDWVYIDDVMDGFLKAAVAAGVEGETFDLGSGEMVSIRDIANRVAVLTESDVQPAFGALPDRAFERERSADTDTTRLRLAWQPRVPLDNGLALTIDWWKKQLAAEGSMPDKVG